MYYDLSNIFLRFSLGIIYYYHHSNLHIDEIIAELSSSDDDDDDDSEWRVWLDTQRRRLRSRRSASRPNRRGRFEVVMDCRRSNAIISFHSLKQTLPLGLGIRGSLAASGKFKLPS